MFADAVNITGGGAETTGAIIARAIFEVIDNPAIYKLTVELREAFSDPESMSVKTLENLPYLTAVIKEALRSVNSLFFMPKHFSRPDFFYDLNTSLKSLINVRLHPGIPGRLPRVVPKGGVQLAGFDLPSGTIVSMSLWVM